MAAGRTPLIKKLSSLMREAHYIKRNPQMKNFVKEAKEAKLYSRRDFLQMMGWAGIGVTGGALMIPKSFAQGALSLVGGSSAGTVGIVGAGAAGLTTAYRLMKAGVACEIFEGSSRIGGRMWTKDNFNSQGMFCELGGELVDTNHADLIDLAAELTADGFPVHIQPLKKDDPGKDVYFIGGKYYFDEDVLELCGPLMDAISRARKDIYVHKDGEETEDYAYETAQKWDDMSLGEFFAKECRDVDPALIKGLDVAYKGEYGLSCDKQSALNLLTFIDPQAYKSDEGDFLVFGESDEAHRVEGGNENLIRALTKAIKGKVNINLGHRLENISDKTSKLELTFSVGGQGSSKTLGFERVVSAIPFTMYRDEVVGGGANVKVLDKLGLPEDKMECIQKYGYGTNAKVMYNFSKKFWRETPLKNQKGQNRMSNGGVVTDLAFNQAWETSRGQKGSMGILTNFFGGMRGADYYPSYRDQAIDELAAVFPGAKRFADPKNIAAMIWPSYVWTKGSYSCPRPGQALTYIELAGRAELGGRLVFAGEHTSPVAPGYMSGGVNSGNLAASTLLGKTDKAEEAPEAAPAPSVPGAESEKPKKDAA